MSYTPESEEIHEEKADLVLAAEALAKKLLNRVTADEGGWASEHKKECLCMHRRLIELILDVREL